MHLTGLFVSLLSEGGVHVLFIVYFPLPITAPGTSMMMISIFGIILQVNMCTTNPDKSIPLVNSLQPEEGTQLFPITPQTKWSSWTVIRIHRSRCEEKLSKNPFFYLDCSLNDFFLWIPMQLILLEGLGMGGLWLQRDPLSLLRVMWNGVGRVECKAGCAQDFRKKLFSLGWSFFCEGGRPWWLR